MNDANAARTQGANDSVEASRISLHAEYGFEFAYAQNDTSVSSTASAQTV